MRRKRQSFRTDPSTADAVQRLAASENKTVPDVMREALLLRLEAGALSELMRITMGEVSAQVVAHAQARVTELGRAWLQHFIESETRERAVTRRDIEDFIAGLKGVAEASASSEPIPPPPKTLRELVAK